MNNNNWRIYSREFEIKAIQGGFTDEEITHHLEYAKNLFEKNLPIIFDQIHLSLLVGYRVDYLRRISNSQKNFYRTFEIPKKSVGMRLISEPLPSLKEIHWWILDQILYKIKVSRYAKSYIKNRSIKSNARFHRNRELLLTIDIEDFFGSLKYPLVYQMFIRCGYREEVATMLSNICTLKNQLPQGAPTSPAISNILFRNVDKRIGGFTKKHEIRYTRYADDMSFSGTFEPGMVIKFVRNVLDDVNLRVNEKKIRVRKKHQRQEVTGIVVNEKMQVPREVRRKLRQSVYYIEKYGLNSHLEHTENTRANHIKHLLGIANFILFVNPEDEEVAKYVRILKEFLD